MGVWQYLYFLPKENDALKFDELSSAFLRGVVLPKNKALNHVIEKSVSKGKPYPFNGIVPNLLSYSGEFDRLNNVLSFGWPRRMMGRISKEDRIDFIKMALRFAKHVNASFVFSLTEPPDGFEKNFTKIDGKYFFTREFTATYFAVIDEIPRKSYDSDGFTYIQTCQNFEIYEADKLNSKFLTYQVS